MFEHLRQLMADGNRNPDYPNVFYPVSDEEVATSERRLGYPLPEQLRAFYREVGYGFFKTATPEASEHYYNHINRFLAASQIADMLLGEDRYSMPEEGFDEGEIPFFEVTDQLYIVLRASPSGSYEVTWPDGEAICGDLIEFARRLAADPSFYHA